jgi:autotransporter-associated beta strand protein
VGGGFAGTMSAELALASNWSDTSTTSGPRTGNGTTPIFVDAGTAFTLSGKIVDGLESSPIGSLNKTGAGTLTLSGNGEYRGTTTVAAGTLKLDGNLHSYFWNGSAMVYGTNGAISVASGATLAGSGSTKGAINGAGMVAPGASPGILTAGSLDASAGTDFLFEFTAANPSYGSPSNSGNDLLRLRDATPFTAALGSQNLISIYLNVSGLTGSDIFRGGFFTDADGSLLSMVQGASYSYFVKGDGLGSFSYNGVTYYSLDQYNTNTSQNISFALASETVTGNFSTGAETGQILSFSTVPEPGSASLAALGLATLLLRKRRCRR